MKTIGANGIGVLACLLVVGCGAAKSGAPLSPSAPSVAGAYGRAPVSGSAAPAEAPATAPAPAPTPAAQPVAPSLPAAQLPRAGQLTAGVWDDNLNFEFWKPYAIRYTEQGVDFQMFSRQEMEAAQREAMQIAPHTDLDVQLVLDTTGSMGDELAYLQSELDAIATQVKTRFPNVTPRWSLVVYRDHGDEYLTRAFDFTVDTTRFRENLRAQRADGGGDTPEAVVEGLGKGLEQKWRGAPNVAKLAFWVADAPAHPGEGKKLADVIRSARQKGVHIYPIASSDTDDTAEYQMRSAAQMTGGRYVFLTDDSGVGNAHAEPHIPCYAVTRLDKAIVRMISVELSGKYVESEPSDVVRTVGAPNQAGKCQLPSGMLVASY